MTMKLTTAEHVLANHVYAFAVKFEKLSHEQAVERAMAKIQQKRELAKKIKSKH